MLGDLICVLKYYGVVICHFVLKVYGVIYIVLLHGFQIAIVCVRLLSGKNNASGLQL